MITQNKNEKSNVPRRFENEFYEKSKRPKNTKKKEKKNCQKINQFQLCFVKGDGKQIRWRKIKSLTQFYLL